MIDRSRVSAARKGFPFSPVLLRQMIDALGGLDEAARVAGVQADRLRAYLREGRLPRRRLTRLMLAYRAQQRGTASDVF